MAFGRITLIFGRETEEWKEKEKYAEKNNGELYGGNVDRCFSYFPFHFSICHPSHSTGLAEEEEEDGGIRISLTTMLGEVHLLGFGGGEGDWPSSNVPLGHNGFRSMPPGGGIGSPPLKTNWH
jgi:hypothetical protein